ncbi:hypothetical protein TsocGM_00720 [Tautonia sociabilis]|uniref:Uncharacterized protein n=1 Tax=Tautonia sociabilis TaxID=2080755 RepID=A0A432MQF8_9BACT|nr:hypothetical protein TsocGM_00720 [Tautonia sociabilis]
MSQDRSLLTSGLTDSTGTEGQVGRGRSKRETEKPKSERRTQNAERRTQNAERRTQNAERRNRGLMQRRPSRPHVRDGQRQTHRTQGKGPGTRHVLAEVIGAGYRAVCPPGTMEG